MNKGHDFSIDDGVSGLPGLLHSFWNIPLVLVEVFTESHWMVSVRNYRDTGSYESIAFEVVVQCVTASQLLEELRRHDCC